ncbi:MAG: sulfatase [Planctomycetales bacterium]|nr:sulfatase [Planctomycetales bacterium]
MRQIVLFSLANLLIGSVFLVPAAQADDKSTPAARPNVLFIAVDDLRPELACYGAPARTPHIDQLAKTGMQFERAYCNQAVCGASRVSLMTGLYPEFTGERTYHVTNWRRRWAHIVTLNQHFTNHGYTTVGLGKIYHGSAGPGVDPEHWSQWLTVKGQEYAEPARLEFVRDRNGRRRGPATENATTSDETHFDGNRAHVGAEQIEKLTEAGEPFFLAVGFTKPHLPFVAPQKYWDMYQRESFRLPPNLGVPPGYPEYARNANAGELRAYSDIPTGGSPTQFSDELNLRLLHGYHACVSYTDRNIGVLLEALERSGAAKNTIVVLWADHGWKLGDHSSWCKHTNFECDTRVPLIVRHPGIAATHGKTTTALVELIDLYPTLCELCGLNLPKHVQGKSFATLLSDGTASHRESAYSSYPHGPVVGHSIRTERYRYTQWWEAKTDKVVDSVLTDITADPGETTAIEKYEDLKSKLSAQLRNRVLAARK